MDTVIALRRPEDYSHEHGARFEIHFEKLRNRADGPGAVPFEARLESFVVDGCEGNRWCSRNLVAPILKRAAALFADGLTVREVAAILRVSKSEAGLPYAVGDGEAHTLNLCAYSGWTSVFVPSAAALEVFSFFKNNARVVGRTQIQTQRLDDLVEVDNIDFLKIDIQGGELAVLAHGREKLGNAVVIQTELQFVNLYEGQPSFGEIDQELRAQGFIPHAFAALKKWPISPLQFGGNPTQPLNQLLEADLVYVRDFVHPDAMSSDQLKHLCLIGHSCYNSFDLAGRCVALLEQRKAIPEGALQRYIEILNRTG